MAVSGYLYPELRPITHIPTYLVCNVSTLGSRGWSREWGLHRVLTLQVGASGLHPPPGTGRKEGAVDCRNLARLDTGAFFSVSKNNHVDAFPKPGEGIHIVLRDLFLQDPERQYSSRGPLSHHVVGEVVPSRQQIQTATLANQQTDAAWVTSYATSREFRRFKAWNLENSCR